MNHTAVKLWMFLMLAVLGVYGTWTLYNISRPRSEAESSTVPSNTRVTDHDLRFMERNGAEFRLDSMEGKLWVASFFFTACPSECRILNQEIAKLQHEFAGKDVTFVSFTCDPDNDTLEVLRGYANRFGADPEQWLFVRGDVDRTTLLGLNVFKVSVVKQSHSDRMILVQPDGSIAGYFSAKDPEQVAKLREQLEVLLKEPAPPSTAGDDASSQN